MKLNLYTKLAVLIIGLAASTTAFADVKIKSKQTASGQTIENTTLIKGKRQRSEMMNGQMISITQCDMRREVRVNPAAQTYQVSTFDIATTNVVANQNQKTKTPNQTGGVITMLVTNKDTGERKQMFGYTARHIITTMETSSSPDACSLTKSKMQIDGWYIDAEFALDCANNRSYANYGGGGGGCQDKYDVKTVGAAKKGYPVLETMKMFDEAGREIMTTTNEVLEISKATLDASLFDVPANYREVKNAAELYANLGATATTDSTNSTNTKNYSGDKDANNREQMNQTIKNLTQTNTAANKQPGAKKEGTIRIGLAGVKTGAVGEGINAQDLAGAVQNTLGEYLKGSKVELVPLDAKLASALDGEAKEKDCDFVLLTTVAYKKGGSGFGMFKSVAPMFSNIVPVASTAGAIAGTVASTAVITAATATANVKAKDEMSLEFNLRQPSGNAPPVSKQLKMKAKSAGEDILSPMIEQAAQTIIDTVIK